MAKRTNRDQGLVLEEDVVYNGTAISVGNPHFVTFVDDVDALDLEKLKLFGTLGRNGINVIACAQGASETNISFVVDSKSLRKSLNVIHVSFFLSEYQVLHLFICGVGTVGGSLVEQIRYQQQNLMMDNGLNSM